MDNNTLNLSDVLKTERLRSDFDFSFEVFKDEKDNEKASPALGGRLLNKMKVSDLRIDRYRYEVREKTLENKYQESIVKEHMIDITVIPLDFPKTGTSIVTDIAGCIFDTDDIACAATMPNGKKTAELSTNNFSFFMRARWQAGEFLSFVNSSGENTEKLEYTCRKLSQKGDSDSIGHPVIKYKKKQIHIAPLADNNINGACPIMVVYDIENTRYVIASDSLVHYADLKLYAKYKDGMFMVYEV